MAEEEAAAPQPASESDPGPSQRKKAKLLKALSRDASKIVVQKFKIDSGSCFVDFAVLRTEYFTGSAMDLAKEYEPYENRNTKKPVSDFAVVLHLLSACIGGGMLGLPMAFQCSGTVIGCIGTPVLGFISFYGFHVLITNQYIQCKRLQAPFLTLSRSMKITMLNGPRCLRCFAPCSPYFIDFILIIHQVGIGSAYITFVAKAIKRLLDEVTKTDYDKIFYIAALLVPFLLMNFIRDLQKMMPASFIGNIMRVAALMCIFYYMFFVGELKFDHTELVARLEKWPIFIGTVIYAFGAPGVIVALHYNMRYPTHFLGCKGLFPWSMVAVTVVYWIVGLLGYLKYGPMEDGATLESLLPKDFWVTKAVTVAYLLGLFCSYPLQMYIAMEIIWGNYMVRHIKNHEREWVYEYLLRICTVMITGGLALAIPDVNIIQSLVGAFCVTFIGLINPFLCDMFTQWVEKEKRFNCKFFRDLILILIGFFIMIVGTYMILDDFVRNQL